MSPTAVDDPSDPGQKRVANFRPMTGVNYVMAVVEPILKVTQPDIAAYEQEGQCLDKNMRAFLLYSFVAETNLRPSQCCLVVKKVDPITSVMFFVPNDANEAQKLTVDSLRKEIADLQKRIVRLEAENNDLRWKR